MFGKVLWFLPILVLGLMAFENPLPKIQVDRIQTQDTLPQVQPVSQLVLNRKEWKRFTQINGITVLDSHVSTNKRFVHWQKNPVNLPKKNLNLVRYPEPVKHAWGFIEKVGNKRILTQLFVAPTNMKLKIQDSIDYNGDGVAEWIIRWEYKHHYNHEFGTGVMQNSGISIWDVQNIRNLLSLMLRSSGSGWNMCSGKSSQYSNHYYDVVNKDELLYVKNYKLGKEPKNLTYVFKQNRFALQN